MTEKHSEYKRKVDGADTAILMVHGILGTPDHFKRLIPLVPETYSVYDILLPGHGGTVEDFSKSTMKQWKDYVRNILEKLSLEYENIHIVAHSMGTLFAIQEAAKNPRVKSLFLLNAPTRPYLHPRLVPPMLAVAFGLEENGNQYVSGMRAAYSIAPEKNILKYIGWIPNYIELFREIAYTRPILKTLEKPVIVLQSYLDELVLRSAYEDLQAPLLKRGWLKKSKHFFYEESDWKKIVNCFNVWITSW